MRKLVLATRNLHKVEEIKAMLAGLPLEVVSVSDYPEAPEVVEDGKTFQANAAKKAETIARYTGEWTLADDSGLEVEFLQGKPGVYSARFAGEDASDAENNAKLLGLMKDVPREKRGAQFRSVIAIARPGEETLFAEGICRGLVGTEAKGFNGFGYDPLFVLPELGKTYAELTPEEKNRVSHRARAMEKAREILAKLTAS
ncbi:MAG: XTP/dITP diphosphatase [Firmicutes bacterium]|nr:XTP/dITP diphosphatase [Bacillota bacterium]